MIQKLLLIIVVLFSILSHVSAQDDTLPLRYIVYLEGDSSSQRLDVYLPEMHDDPVPVVVILHGSRGNKSEYASWAEHLNEQGYAVVAPNHRAVPDQNADGFCSIAWVHANAEAYGLDTNHLFVIGWSFGGGVASEIGMIDSDVDPFAEFACPYPIPETWTSGTILLAAASAQSQGPVWRVDKPPLIWLDGSENPFLLIHGGTDLNIPVGVSGYLAAELEAAGVKVEFVILSEAGHFFPLYGEIRDEAWQMVDKFIAEQIGLEDE